MKTIHYAALLASIFIILTGTSYAETRIGISAPLSGPLAEYGQAVTRGIRLAEEEHNAEPKRVLFDIEDNKFDSATSISVLRKLSSNVPIKALYSWGEPVLYATAKMLGHQAFPTFSLSNDDIPARDIQPLINMQLPPRGIC